MAATIAGQCFSPEGLGLNLGILREEPCKVGLASEFPTNLGAREGAESSLFFLERESPMPWEEGSRLLRDPGATLSPEVISLFDQS